MKKNHILFVSLLIALFLMAGSNTSNAELPIMLKTIFKKAIKNGKNEQGNYVYQTTLNNPLIPSFENSNELAEYASTHGYVLINAEFDHSQRFYKLLKMEFRLAEDYHPNEITNPKASVDEFLGKKVAGLTPGTDGSYTITVGLDDYALIEKQKSKMKQFKVLKHEQRGIKIDDGTNQYHAKHYYPTHERLVVLPTGKQQHYTDTKNLEAYYHEMDLTRDCGSIRSLLAKHPEVKEYPENVLNHMVHYFWEQEIRGLVGSVKSRDKAIESIRNLPDVVRYAPQMKENILRKAKRFDEGEGFFTRKDYYQLYHDYGFWTQADIDDEENIVFNHIANENDLKYYLDFFPNGKHAATARRWYDNGTYTTFYKELAATLLDQYVKNCNTYISDRLAGRENNLFNFSEKIAKWIPTTEGWWDGKTNGLYWRSASESARNPLQSKYARLSDYLVSKFSTNDKYHLLAKAQELLSCTVILNGFIGEQIYSDCSRPASNLIITDKESMARYTPDAFKSAIGECEKRLAKEPGNKMASQALSRFSNQYRLYKIDVENYKSNERAWIEAYRANMCENCKFVAKETIFPEGYVDRYEFLFLENKVPPQSAEAGKFVLKNRDVIEWKYFFTEVKMIKIISCSMHYDLKGKQFRTVDEMMKAILEKCKKLYCE